MNAIHTFKMHIVYLVDLLNSRHARGGGVARLHGHRCWNILESIAHRFRKDSGFGKNHGAEHMLRDPAPD
eukprot:SAG31_NODE_2057_length_6542_cov_2.889182_5_plen_70_part_00